MPKPAVSGYPKDFDQWNRLKKALDRRERYPFASPGEIWWCALGLNVGIEINGKHEHFERPVVILRAYNTEMLKAVPLTTRPKRGKFYFEVKAEGIESYAVLTQGRVISARRLLRKVGKLDSEQLEMMKGAMRPLEL
jgi:mRNA interferase MazF